jgi:hypothetical protein
MTLDNQKVVFDPTKVDLLYAKNDKQRKSNDLKKFGQVGNVVGILKGCAGKEDKYEVKWCSTLIQGIVTKNEC